MKCYDLTKEQNALLDMMSETDDEATLKALKNGEAVEAQKQKQKQGATK